MSDSPLEILQSRFIDSILRGPQRDFAAAVTGAGKLSADAAVAVYRRGYPARLTEALGETFEACWRVLGDEDFFTTCRGFIAQTPSKTHNLSDYGAQFPQFLESLPEAAGAPYLGDLARYEWVYKELFHTPPHLSLTPTALAAAARPGSILIFGQAMRLMSLRHRVYGIWKRDRADDTPLSRSDWEGCERLVLYKNGGNALFVRLLSVSEHAALEALALGRPLDEALAGVEGLDAVGARALFSFISESGLVAGVS